MVVVWERSDVAAAGVCLRLYMWHWLHEVVTKHPHISPKHYHWFNCGTVIGLWYCHRNIRGISARLRSLSYLELFRSVSARYLVHLQNPLLVGYGSSVR
jgi:hypothetical protein